MLCPGVYTEQEMREALLYSRDILPYEKAAILTCKDNIELAIVIKIIADRLGLSLIEVH